MKVNDINSITNFKAANPFVPKKHYINASIKSKANTLMKKMNHETKYQENETGVSFVSNILASINMVNMDIKFVDERFLVGEVANPEKYPGICSLKIGKSYLSMDTNSGEVLAHKKSIFKTWRSFLSQAEVCLQNFIDNFDKPDIVRKSSFSITDFTKKGAKRLEEAKEKMGYYG